MKTIAVYYIATNVYCELFKPFIESLHKFMPDCKKIVVLLTDGLNEYEGYEDKENNIVIDRRNLTHFPWPIVTLYKHYLINANRIDCDYAVYFNADTVCRDYDWENNPFSDSKITLTTHTTCRVDESTIKARAFWYWFDACDCSSYAEVLRDPEVQNEKYVQASFFFGPSNKFFKMCEEIAFIINDDMLHKCAFLRWHDETYMNVWVLDNLDKVVILPRIQSCFNDGAFFKSNSKKINKG